MSCFVVLFSVLFRLQLIYTTERGYLRHSGFYISLENNTPDTKACPSRIKSILVYLGLSYMLERHESTLNCRKSYFVAEFSVLKQCDGSAKLRLGGNVLFFDAAVRTFTEEDEYRTV